MTARVVVGQRGSEYGLWASPPGVDAFTASSSQLILQMSNLIDQIVLTGSVSTSAVVPLGLASRPLVLLISRGFRPGFGDCATRPSPLGTDQRNCSVSVSESQMVISAPQTLMYAVFRKTF